MQSSVQDVKLLRFNGRGIARIVKDLVDPLNILKRIIMGHT